VNISIEKIFTFGSGVQAYRIVQNDNQPVDATDHKDAERPIHRTDDAKRLGDQLREQFKSE
jgi:hypothetical protein